MKIFVKRLTGECIPFNVEPTDMIDDLKVKIEEKTGIPVDQQRVCFDGRPVANGTLADYGICNNSTLHLVLMLMG